MLTAKVTVDCDRIHDWNSFHDEFARVFGVPEFYGRNMDAWIDCLTSLDAVDDGMSAVHYAAGSVMTLELENMGSFRERCRELYDALLKCSAFVNWRRIELGGTAVLALSFWT